MLLITKYTSAVSRLLIAKLHRGKSKKVHVEINKLTVLASFPGPFPAFVICRQKSGPKLQAMKGGGLRMRPIFCKVSAWIL